MLMERANIVATVTSMQQKLKDNKNRLGVIIPNWKEYDQETQTLLSLQLGILASDLSTTIARVGPCLQSLSPPCYLPPPLSRGTRIGLSLFAVGIIACLSGTHYLYQYYQIQKKETDATITTLLEKQSMQRKQLPANFAHRELAQPSIAKYAETVCTIISKTIPPQTYLEMLDIKTSAVIVSGCTSTESDIESFMQKLQEHKIFASCILTSLQPHPKNSAQIQFQLQAELPKAS